MVSVGLVDLAIEVRENDVLRRFLLDERQRQMQVDLRVTLAFFRTLSQAHRGEEFNDRRQKEHWNTR